MAASKVVKIHKTGGSASRPKRRPRRPKQKSNLMPLFIILALVIGGTGIMISTIKSNRRKAVALAIALDHKVRESETLLNAITDAADRVKELNTKAKQSGQKATALISSTLAGLELPEQEAGAKQLTDYRDALEQQLTLIDDCNVNALDMVDLARRDLAEIKREKRLPNSEMKHRSMKERESLAENLLGDARLIREELDRVVENIEEQSLSLTEQAEAIRLAEKVEQERKELEQRLKADNTTAANQKKSMLEKIAIFNFESALKDLEMGADRYKTDAGHKLHALMIDQCKPLIEMKAEIISQISAEPFAWGWRQEGSPRDISGATVNGIVVADRMIPWENIKLPQLTLIMNKYICGQQVMPKTKSDHCIAAAIFFAANQLYAEAKTLLDTGISMRPALEPEAKRLTETILKKE